MRTQQHIVNKRVRDVLQLLIQGQTRPEILQYISENYELTERQGDSYIKKANDLIKESFTKDITRDFNKALLRFEQLYKIHFDSGEHKTCVAINKEICQLQGLYTMKIEHSGNVQFISNIPE